MPENKINHPERRDFLKLAGAAAISGFPAIISAQTVTNAIKVGLVGCGGRGTGAASQALNADDYAELTAVADIDQSQIDKSLWSVEADPENRRPREGRSSQAVPRPRCLPEGDRQRSRRGAARDASRLPSDVTWPPASRPASTSSAKSRSRPTRLASAPCSKPSRRRRQKNLSLVAGFCWRYNDMIQDTSTDADGAIGRLVAYYATYYTSPVKPMPPAARGPPA